MRERAQALTLEGSIAAVLVVMSLVFALQVSAVTPLTESTTSQHIENQQKAVGQNVLATAAEDGSLKSTVLFWNASTGRYQGSDPSEEAYLNGVPDDADHEAIHEGEHEDVIEFGETLNKTFTSRGIAYNIHASNVDDGDIAYRNKTIVNQGEPSDHAVTVTETVTLYEDDTLYSDGGDLEDFYVPRENEDTYVYNVVEVELVIWRM